MLRQATLTRRLCSLCLSRHSARRTLSAQPAFASTSSDHNAQEHTTTQDTLNVQVEHPDITPDVSASPDLESSSLEKSKRSPRTKAVDGQAKSKRTKKASAEEASGEPPSPSKKVSKSKKAAETKPHRNPLLPNTTDIQLENQQAWAEAGRLPALEDVEAFRPSSHAPANSAVYADQYTNLVSELCRAFSRDQLRHLAEQYQLRSSLFTYKRKKLQFAEAIVEEAWKWPSLSKLQKDLRDRTEHIQLHIPLSAAELFTVLGKDGANLLQLSLQHDVYTSITREPRLGLLIEGVRNRLKEVEDKVAAVKKAIVSEAFALPSGQMIEPKLIQRLSRLADAFVQNEDKQPGTVRLTGRDQRRVDIAKRLAAHAVSEYQEMVHIPTIIYEPAKAQQSTPIPLSIFPPSYSLYPFLSPLPLPWTMPTSGAFRLRRVGEWLGHDAAEDIGATGGLAGDGARFFNFSLQRESLKDILLRSFGDTPHVPGAERHITASLGHLLYSSSSTSQRATLVPPVGGARSFEKWLNWLKAPAGKNSATFVPSLPVPLLDTPPTSPAMLRRLVYRSTIAAQSSSPSPAALAGRHSRLIELEIGFKRVKREAQTSPEAPVSQTIMDVSSTATISSPSGMETGREVSLPATDETAEPSLVAQARCIIGTHHDLNLLIPDRPMDLRFTAKETAVVPADQQPAGLREYIANYQAFLGGRGEDPVAPLLVGYQGETFVLEHSANVRQSQEQVLIKSPGFGGRKEAPSASVPAVSETIVGQETLMKSMLCQIECSDWSTEVGWTKFLKQCDHLSAAVYQPTMAMSLQLDLEDNADSSGDLDGLWG